MKTSLFAALLGTVLCGQGLAAEATAPKPVAYTPDKPVAVAVNTGGADDAAFVSDLKTAEEFLRGIAREKNMDPGQYRTYNSREIEKAKKFYRFAAAEVVPHTRAMSQKMRDPDALMAEGARMVEADPASWKGYDYMANGNLLKDRPAEAMAQFEKALKAAPEAQKDWYRYMIAGCLNIAKETDKALAMYDGVIARNDNWLAAKSAYVTASMILIGRDDAKAALYFDRGLNLRNPGERRSLLATGICDKFSAGVRPKSCAGAN